jgi:hypothetical protein
VNASNTNNYNNNATNSPINTSTSLISSNSTQQSSSLNPTQSSRSAASKSALLSQFVGGISTINSNTTTSRTNQNSNNSNNSNNSDYGKMLQFNNFNEASFNHFNNQMINYLNQQHQHMNRKMDDEINMSAFHNHHNQQQQQLHQLRVIKRRSITASPVRYNNFSSKSSPPVTNRGNQSDFATTNNENNYYNEMRERESFKLSQLNQQKAQMQMRSNHKGMYNAMNRSGGGSDMGEAISTDSDIGTSPSATTLASPPSSPQQILNMPLNAASYMKLSKSYHLQQQQQQQHNQNNQQQQQQQQTTSSSIIRQHSYLNAVQLNDYKQMSQHQSSRQQVSNFNEMNENDPLFGSLTTRQQQQLQRQRSTEVNTEPYYYSPSATLAREQRHLLHLQKPPNESNAVSSSAALIKRLASIPSTSRNNNVNNSNYAMPSLLDNKSDKKGKSSSDLIEPETTNKEARAEADTNSSSSVGNEKIVKQTSHQYRKKTVGQENRHPFQQRSQTISSTVSTSNSIQQQQEAQQAAEDEKRRSSYMKATNKHLEQPAVPEQTSNNNVKQVKSVSASATPQQSRNTSIKKLKSFFGEKVSILTFFPF